MKSDWKNYKIGEFAKRSKIPTKVADSILYKRLTIRMHGLGIVLRDEISGSLIGTKNQFFAKGGQFLLSKIDARNGAFGILSQDLDGALISNSFQAYDLDKNIIDIDYFNYFTKTHSFIDFCNKASEGTTNRRNLDDNKFLSFEIPLPPLPEQKRIVKKIKEIEEKIGFTQSKIRKESMILDSIFPSLYNSLIKKEESENSTVSLGKIIKRYKKEILIKDNIEYKRITIRTNNLGISMRDSLLGEKIGTKKQFMVKADQLLLSKIDARNGAFGIVPKDLDGAIITGNFWAYDINDALVDNEFIRQFVQTESFSEFCKRSSSGATNRRYLDETIFLNQLIVLPNKKTQDQICSMGLLSQSFKKNRNNQNKILNFLIPSVLAKAFNGDL